MNAMPAVGLTAPPVPFVPVEHHIKTGYDKGAYFEEFTDEMIEVLTTYGLEKKSPLSLATFYRLDEAYSEVGEDDTAYMADDLLVTSGRSSPRVPIRNCWR